MKVLILALLIIVSSCKQESEKKNSLEIQAKETIKKVMESNFTVLPFNTNWNWIFKNVKITELSKTEINEIELILEKVVEENNQIEKESLQKHNKEYPKQKWDETGFELGLGNRYYRQYVPVINDKGEKEIWINFFCSTMGYNWKTNLILVEDGGNCFFNIKINLTKKEYSDLRINGSA